MIYIYRYITHTRMFTYHYMYAVVVILQVGIYEHVHPLRACP